MSTKKARPQVYVVTRNKRRIEHNNYFSEESAKTRAEVLRKTLKKWKDPDSTKVEVVQTSEPHKIW